MTGSPVTTTTSSQVTAASAVPGTFPPAAMPGETIAIPTNRLVDPTAAGLENQLSHSPEARRRLDGSDDPARGDAT
jgi:hypothetical protein